MNINEQFERFLADLGVEMERPDEDEREQHDKRQWLEKRNGQFRQDGQDMQSVQGDCWSDDILPEVSIFQASRDHYGVFYRLDILDTQPELRVLMPVERGAVKMDVYLVRLSERMPLTIGFAELGSYQGSNAYEHGREATLQHMLYAVAEMMKQLFWSGDLSSMTFPPEIEVYPLLRVGR
ncbi:MAG TPA: hypothetical protein DHW02_21335 [Ktedonobacter sp.]|nr:hypothetical protein [Ktedonobacter sp.]